MGRVSDARLRLVVAATELTWLKSYGAVGVDAICERAGVKKGSFYHFFRSKDDLLVEALEAHWQSRKATFDRIFSPSRPPLDRLKDYLANVCERQLKLRKEHGRVLGCFHASLGTECIDASPAIAAKVKEILRTYTRYLESAFRDAQALRVVPKADPKIQAQTLFAYVEGILGQARIHDDAALLRRLPRSALAFLGLGLGGQSRAQPNARP